MKVLARGGRLQAPSGPAPALPALAAPRHPAPSPPLCPGVWLPSASPTRVSFLFLTFTFFDMVVGFLTLRVPRLQAPPSSACLSPVSPTPPLTSSPSPAPFSSIHFLSGSDPSGS